jgi:hypothetical protein
LPSLWTHRNAGDGLKFASIANATAQPALAAQLTAYFASDTINAWKLGHHWPGFLLARLCDNIHKVAPPAQNPR